MKIDGKHLVKVKVKVKEKRHGKEGHTTADRCKKISQNLIKIKSKSKKAAKRDTLL